jgi:hypothetical protein
MLWQQFFIDDFFGAIFQSKNVTAISPRAKNADKT